MRIACPFLSALSCVLIAAHAEAQTTYRNIHPARVWTVNAEGGGDFLDLPRAVAAASSGDVLLVAPATTYSAFVLRKGLTILGDGGIPRINGSILVEGLRPDEVACLRSLEVNVSSLSSQAVRLRNNAGIVWIEDCAIHTSGFFFTSPAAAVRAEDCADVVFVRSQIVGSLTTVLPLVPPTGAGLHALRSDVHAFETLFQGVSVTQGASGGSNPSLGGDGATLVDSTLDAVGSYFLGGQGQAAAFNFFAGSCESAQPGGAGLHAGLASSPPILVDCTLQGGPGGNSAPPSCSAAPAGPASVGMLDVEALPLRSYELESPVRGGTSCQLTAVCQPGELVWSMLSESLEPLYVPSSFGTQVGALPTLVFEGVAGPTGTLSKSVPIPPLATLVKFEALWAQGLFVDALSNAYLGTPSVLVVVD